MRIARDSFSIDGLKSGGLITNYNCTSRCLHCLYCCSPYREKAYIGRDAALENLATIKELGCSSVHVGGGEPFLDPEGLEGVLDAAMEAGVRIDYVETNSSWYRDRESAAALLGRLKQKGLSTLLVSISPFHNEHIPFSRVKGVIGACRDASISIFPWTADFYGEVNGFENRLPHGPAEYLNKFGPDYFRNVPGRYWVHFGGRALTSFRSYFPAQDADGVAASARGCTELLNTSHFHLDLFGNYIPGLCSGLAVRREDLGKPLPAHKYPFLSTLYRSGVKGLLDHARKGYGFQPEGEYISACHLCTEIRAYLVLRPGVAASIELQPAGFYREYASFADPLPAPPGPDAA
jgi:hypothetical protein